MGKKALRKDFYMEIRRTINRFLSLFLITALGVAFFSGVRASEPDMQRSADAFYDESNLMDLQVMGTLGMTEGDVEAIMAVDGVKEVMPSWSVDMFGLLAGEQLNLQVMSFPDTMNRLQIQEGRLPETQGECLVDDKLVDEGRCRVGDTITLKSATDTDTTEILSEDTFTVTGSVSSPCYMSLERGTTSIGNGTLDGFLALPSSAFALDYYTQICVTAEGASSLLCYTEAYDTLIDDLTERLESIEEERCSARYDEIQQEGWDKIADAEADLEEGEQRLADAGEELEDAREKLEEARTELEKGQREFADGQREIAEKEQELLDAKQEVADGWAELNQAKEELVLATYQIQKGYREYEAGKAKIESGYAQIRPYQEQRTGLEESLQEIKAGIDALEAQLEDPNLDETTREELNNNLLLLEGQRQACQDGISQINERLGPLEAELDAGAASLSEGKAELDEASRQVESGNRKAYYAEQDLREAEEEIADGERKLADGRAELEKARRTLADAETELADAGQKLADGEAEYEDARLENERIIADAREEIADAKQELSDLDVPEWYVLDRQYIAVYVDYGQNSERIGAIGEVFPVIFFLVAALVCLTTMTRMVEEQRTQIGTLKALGYGRGAIAAKYMLYAFLSSLSGSLFGLVVGQKLLPTVIISAYKILYTNLPAILTPLNASYSVSATAAAVFCTTAAAWAASYKALTAVPAELMRPSAPKAGKRVFLEYLPFLWRRLNFSQKAAVRNLLRYKKRFFMTVFGIGGCMALLLVGFGLKDSILYIGSGQFGNVFVYDASIGIDQDSSAQERQRLLADMESDERILRFMEMRETALDAEAYGVVKSAYLVVPEDSGKLDDYIRLQDRETGERYHLDSEGIVVSEKLASILGIEEGDTLILKEDTAKRVEARVSHITENYFMHYIYMDARLYEELFGKEPEWNMVFTGNVQNDGDFEERLQADYMEKDAVYGVSFTSGTAQHVADLLQSMDLIIYVLVIAAGLLAFVVLYNLNNININERRRELATLKVLGFFDREVSGYVNRENVLLTILGTAAGIVFGILLHRFVVTTAETETLMFGRIIRAKSYVYSVILTFVFSAAVNFAMFFKLKGIDMVESLKSVE